MHIFQTSPFRSAKIHLSGGKFFPWVLVVGLLFFSCSELESVPDDSLASEAQALKMGLNPKDPGLSFAKALAIGLKDESVRRFVSDNIQNQFDGDLNFLYYTTKGKSLGGPLSKSITFEEALFGSQSGFRMTASSLEFDPLMQIALRGPEELLVDFTGIEENIPVLYLSPSQDLEADPFVPMITEGGALSTWDMRTVPDKPVLVISQNERLVKVPKNAGGRIQNGDSCLQRATPYFSDGGNYYYFYTDYYCSGEGSNDNPPGGGAIGCDRDVNNKSDHVNQIKFESMGELNRAEPWENGAPELFFIVFTGSVSTHLQQIRKNVPKVDRSKWKDCGLFNCVTEWNYTDIELFHWDKTQFAETMTFKWFEYDGGGFTTIKTESSIPNSLGGTTKVEISSTVNKYDDDLGTAFVNYCDKATINDFKIHSSSSLFFGLRLDD